MKTKLLVLSSLLIVTIAKAQGPYAGIHIGYGAPGSMTILGQNSESNNPANTFSDENVKGSYGTGFNFSVYGGEMIDNNFGLELGVNYLLGSKYDFTDNRVPSPNVTDNFEDEVYARSLLLVPALRIEFGEKKIRFYVRGGATIGVMSKIIDNSTETFMNPGTTQISLQTFEYKKGVSIGFTSALGLKIPLNDKMFFTAEATNYYINWAPSKGEITKATLNGADQLGGMTTNQKEYEFVDKVDQSMNNSTAEPTKQLKTYFPMNSFGLTVGLHFAFGG